MAINVRSFITTKDLDDYVCGSSEAEKQSYLAILILKHSHRIKILQKSYESGLDDKDSPKRNAVRKEMSNEIQMGFESIYAECDKMLVLTNQKTAVLFADTHLKKQKRGEEKMREAEARRQGKVPVAESPLSSLIAMNLKFDARNKVEMKPTSNRDVVGLERGPSSAKCPYVEEEETHTTFYFDLRERVQVAKSRKQRI
jgi:hypothetical protein